MAYGLHQFQSTLPARGATVTEVDMQIILEISIHAPRTGSDTYKYADLLEALQFQSTLPARGATAVMEIDCGRMGYFNPRSPHGERPGERSP